MNAFNGDDGLRPVLLSELIEDAAKALQENGDIPVWITLSEPGYDRNIEITQPLCIAKVSVFHAGHERESYGDRFSNFDLQYEIHGTGL